MIRFIGLDDYSNVLVLKYQGCNSEDLLWDAGILNVDYACIFDYHEVYNMNTPRGVIDLTNPVSSDTSDFIAVLQLNETVTNIDGFSEVSTLEKVIYMGTNFTTIADNCFRNADKLIEVNLGQHIDTIGINAFYNCEELLKIYYHGNSNTIISSGAFSKCGFSTINIPDNVTTIASGAFSGCEELTEIIIPTSVTTIASKAFSECPALKTVVIEGASTNSISADAFYKCDNIENISINTSNPIYFDGGITLLIFHD